MTIVKELAVVKSTYTNKAGEEKKVWQNIGAIHEHEGRQYITMDTIYNLAAFPRKAGDDRLFISIFEPRPKGELKAIKPQADDSDLPF